MRRDYSRSIAAPASTYPFPRRIDGVNKTNSVTRSEAASGKSAMVGTAAWCSIAPGTERRNYYTDSKKAVVHARSILVGNMRVDTQKNQNHERRRFSSRAAPRETRRKSSSQGSRQSGAG